MTDPRIDQAFDEWRAVAPSLGMNADAFRHELIWQKNEAGRSHVVLKLHGPGGRKLIMKKLFLAEQHSRARDSINFQAQVSQAMGSSTRFQVPNVLYAADDGALSVMEFLPGKTLNDHLELGRAPARLLRLSGRWLDRFHRSFPTEKRQYQPHFMVNHILRLAEGVEDGKIQVADAPLFLRCCAEIPGIAERFVGQETISAIRHGDFNLRNILIGPDIVAGLDFSPQGNAPAGFDIVRLLLDYVELFQDPAGLQPGQLFDPSTLRPFFKGYQLVGPQDPAVGFLAYVQFLNDWRTIPANMENRSFRQLRRLACIRQLAENVFLK